VGFWHRTKVMLGLADDYDDEYEEHEYEDEAYAPDAQQARPSYDNVYPESPQSIRRVNREAAPLRAVGGYADPGAAPSATAQVQMHIVEPRSFTEAQSIADKFKLGVPVIMNLSNSDAELAKRLIDFTSGLTYGVDGGLQKVADRVFMLTPANVAVSAEDRRRLRDKGLFSLDA
jgi:cell division inhibitor SepF